MVLRGIVVLGFLCTASALTVDQATGHETEQKADQFPFFPNVPTLGGMMMQTLERAVYSQLPVNLQEQFENFPDHTELLTGEIDEDKMKALVMDMMSRNMKTMANLQGKNFDHAINVFFRAPLLNVQVGKLVDGAMRMQRSNRRKFASFLMAADLAPLFLQKRAKINQERVNLNLLVYPPIKSIGNSGQLEFWPPGTKGLRTPSGKLMPDWKPPRYRQNRGIRRFY